MDVRVGLWRKLSAEKLMLLKCGVEKTLESPLDCKEIQPVHPKGDQSWVFIGGCKELMHLKRLWCWERWRAGREGDDRRWDGWMASLTRWAWVWVNYGSLWWTGRPSVLQFMGSQRVGHDWVTKLNWTGGSEVKASTSNVRDLGSIPGSGRSPGEGNGNPLQYSCLENPMDGGAW